MILKKVLKKGPDTTVSSACPSERQLGRTGFLLNKAAQRIREVYEETLKPTGLTGKHSAVLFILEEKGPVSQHDLGKLAYIDRTTIVGLIDDLEKLALVERKAHPLDRRSHAIYLTAKGKELLPLINRRAFEAERKFLDCLGAQEQEKLIKILRELVLSHYIVTKELR
jgi:DNA-binding MarR family transcriptional regulator